MKLLEIHILWKKVISNISVNKCRNNPNEAQNISNEIKAALKKMSMEQGLYTQVVMIFRRDSYDEK